MSGKPMQEPIVYVQRDIEAIKHALDKVLKPYKEDVKRLANANKSHVENLRRKHSEVEQLLALIAKRSPDVLEDALAILADPNRRGWKKFRAGWLQRLGLT